MILRHRQRCDRHSLGTESETMLAAAAIDVAEKRLTRGLIVWLSGCLALS